MARCGLLETNNPSSMLHLRIPFCLLFRDLQDAGSHSLNTGPSEEFDGSGSPGFTFLHPHVPSKPQRKFVGDFSRAALHMSWRPVIRHNLGFGTDKSHLCVSSCSSSRAWRDPFG